MDLVQKVEKIIIQERLADEGDGIVVAVSGGPDSTALLHILFLLAKSWKWRLIVAHVNHQFRGEEADSEANFVAEYAKKLALPFELANVDIPRYMQENKLNGQLAAREKRYEFLTAVAEKYDVKRIALAHHADDQAETVLMRLLRGTGPSGLSGIPVRRMIKNVELIRPLLRIYKSELLQYCQKHEIGFRIDSSNMQNKYLRNRLRNELMPSLKQYNFQLPKVLNHLAEVIRAEDDYLTLEVDTVFHRQVVVNEAGMHLSRKEFILLPLALQRRLIKLILTCLAPNMDSFDFLTMENVCVAIMRQNPSTLKLNLGASLLFTREYEQIRFSNGSDEFAGFHYQINDFNDPIVLPDGRELHCEVFASDKMNRSISDHSHNTAMFDCNSLCLPLSVRNRRNGDRMDVYGLNGSKKIKDIFIDAKLPVRLRNQVPMVVDANERIIWVPGFRQSMHAIVSDDTSTILYMALHNT